MTVQIYWQKGRERGSQGFHHREACASGESLGPGQGKLKKPLNACTKNGF